MAALPKMDLFVLRTVTFTTQRVRWSCWHVDREWYVPVKSYKIVCQSHQHPLTHSRCERVVNTARQRALAGNRVGEWRGQPVALTDASTRVRAKCGPPTAADMCSRCPWRSAFLRSEREAIRYKKTAPPSAPRTRIPIIMCAAVTATFTRPLASWTCWIVGKCFVVPLHKGNERPKSELDIAINLLIENHPLLWIFIGPFKVEF